MHKYVAFLYTCWTRKAALGVSVKSVCELDQQALAGIQSQSLFMKKTSLSVTISSTGNDVFYFVRHSAGAFQGSSICIVFSSVRFVSFAVFISQVRYLYGSSPFSIAVWITLNIIALPVAPFGVLVNRKFFRSMTNGLILRSALLLEISNLPSFR